MKKLLIAGLSAAVLLATSSVAFAANPTGKVSGFYSPATGESTIEGYKVFDSDVNNYGFSGEISFGNKFGIDGSYVKGTVDVNDSDISMFDINGTYTLQDSKSTGKMDATLGYFQFDNDDSDYTASGAIIGIKGNYDFGNKFGFDYKLAYAPSVTVEVNGNEPPSGYDANVIQYKLGATYEINKQFTVDAGFKGTNINTTISGIDGETRIAGFYVGGSVKF